MITVHPFAPEYLPDFVSLNRQWIEHYFALEAADLKQLEDPYSQILGPGGEILVLREEEITVGVVALIPHGPGTFELAKMAVSPLSRGRGHGDILMRAAIAWAKERGAERLMLLSNTALEPAIALYKKHGFATLRLGPHPDYERANIEMELTL